MEGKFKPRINGDVPASLGRPVGVIAIDESPSRMRRTFGSSGRKKPVILRHDVGAGPTLPPHSTDHTVIQEDILDGGQVCDIKFIDVPKNGPSLLSTSDPNITGGVLSIGRDRVPRGSGVSNKLIRKGSVDKMKTVDSGSPSGRRRGASNSDAARSGAPSGSGPRSGTSAGSGQRSSSTTTVVNNDTVSPSNVTLKSGNQSGTRNRGGVPGSGYRNGVPGSGSRSNVISRIPGPGTKHTGASSGDGSRSGASSSIRPSSGRNIASAGRNGTDRSGVSRSGTDRSGASRSGTDRSGGSRSDTSHGSASGGGRSSALSTTRSTYSDALDSEISRSLEGKVIQKPHRVIEPHDILDQNQESECENIYEINLHASELTVISNLEKFTKVRVLDLSCNFIEKIENLEPNFDLRELKLYDNRLHVLERLRGNLVSTFPDLDDILYRRPQTLGNVVKGQTSLDACKELCSLQLQHNKIRQIGKGLNGLKKLKHLRIDCNRLIKLEAAELSCCPQLTTLDISFNIIDNISALNYLPHLEELLAAGNRLRSVELSRCKRLHEVDLSNNKITDITGLRGLPNLQILNIGSNQLASLKGLGKSKSLQEIHVADNKLTELSYLPAHFSRLEILNVTDNCIEDFDEVYHLEELEELAELFIAGNPFSDLQGSHTHYMAEVQVILPKLEILDGAHVKRTAQKGAPLMRPMSASTIISVRQVEAQMKSTDNEMKDLENSILKQFDSLKEVYETLPERPLSPLTSENSTDGQRKTRSRARIQDAIKFAADNF